MTLAERLSSNLSAIFGRKPPVADDLRESELRFRQVTENIREAFFLVDSKMSRVYYISPGWEEICGARVPGPEFQDSGFNQPL